MPANPENRAPEPTPATEHPVVRPSLARSRTRAALWFLFVIHCSLRLSGLGWNIARHSAFPSHDIPTYHIDEYLLIDGLRSDYRLFSDYSIKTDGPLSINLVYLPLRLSGESPPDTWHPERALLWGRWISALSDCLAFPLLWNLLLALGVSPAWALLGVATLAFMPNHVFNAHFARSHTLAGVLQLLTWFGTWCCLVATVRAKRWTWFTVAAVAAILAGSARYPFLTLGVFPAGAAVWLLACAQRRGDLAKEVGSCLVAIAIAVAAGLALGFGFRPVEILRAGFQAQQAVGQFPWGDVRALLASAGGKVLSTVAFPGGVLRGILMAAVPAGLLLKDDERPPAAKALVAAIVAWAVLYLLLWAKFGIPWQRYSMPFSLAMLVAGIFGLDQIAHRVQERWAVSHWVTSAAAFVLLLPSAGMSALVTSRFVDDASNPLYRLSQELAAHRPRTVYVSAFWSWNRAVLSHLVPPGTELRFVADRRSACETARPGDALVDFAFSPLRGTCEPWNLAPEVRLSNLGPAGFPFPADIQDASWEGRHYEDYHYLFEDVRISVVQGPGHPAHGGHGGRLGP